MRVKYIVALAAVMALSIITAPAVSQDAPAAEDILTKTLDRQYDDMTLQVKLVKVSRSGREREMELEVKIKKDGDATRTKAEFTAPPEIAGMTSLSWDYTGTVEPSDRWFRLAGLNYVKCVGRACSSMEDRFGFSMDIFAIRLDEAEHTLLGEEEVDGTACWKVESKTKEGVDRAEDKFITWVDKKMYAARKIEAYEGGEVTQRSLFTGFKELAGHWWETKGTLEQVGSKKEVRFEILEAKANTGIPDEVFEKPRTFDIQGND